MARPPKHRAVLTRSAVVQAAADLVTEEGAGALTINRLAHRLGVQPPSLYNHIAGLAGLWRELNLICIRSLGDRIVDATNGKSGAEALAALARTYRAYVKEFPHLYLASLRASGNLETVNEELRTAEERIVGVALAIVSTYGLEGEDAIHTVRAIRSMLHGFTTLEVAGGFGLAVDLDESFKRLVKLMIHGLEK